MRSTISFDYEVESPGSLVVGGTMACGNYPPGVSNRQFRIDIVDTSVTGQSWFGSPALGLLKNTLVPVANGTGHVDVDVSGNHLSHFFPRRGGSMWRGGGGRGWDEEEDGEKKMADQTRPSNILRREEMKMKRRKDSKEKNTSSGLRSPVF